MTLNDRQVSIAIHALRVAAERYREDARTMRSTPQFSGLAGQFDRQALDALQLADDLERSEEDTE